MTDYNFFNLFATFLHILYDDTKSFVASNEGLKILDTAYVEEDYAICVAKENTELLDSINGALAELTADGTVKNIIEKYIPAE